jgi:hypothetical protein
MTIFANNANMRLDIIECGIYTAVLPPAIMILEIGSVDWRTQCSSARVSAQTVHSAPAMANSHEPHGEVRGGADRSAGASFRLGRFP